MKNKKPKAKNSDTNNNICIVVVIFSIVDGKLGVLLGRNRKLPQGNVGSKETVDHCAQRLFKHETGISLAKSYIEQLYTFDTLNAPVTVSYLALVPHTKLASDFRIAPIQMLKKNTIVRYAIKRLRWKLEYTNVAYSLLPSVFTLSELQSVYEIILGKHMDKRNFRKKILSLKMLTNTQKKRRDVGHRPAALYAFRHKQPMIIEVL